VLLKRQATLVVCRIVRFPAGQPRIRLQCLCEKCEKFDLSDTSPRCSLAKLAVDAIRYNHTIRAAIKKLTIGLLSRSESTALCLACLRPQSFCLSHSVASTVLYIKAEKTKKFLGHFVSTIDAKVCYVFRLRASILRCLKAAESQLI